MYVLEEGRASIRIPLHQTRPHCHAFVFGIGDGLVHMAVSIVDPERLEEHGARLENIIEEQEALLEQLKDRGEESGEQVDESYE